MINTDLIDLAEHFKRIRESIGTPKAGADPDVPRLLAIARTHLETAELFLLKAANHRQGDL